MKPTSDLRQEIVRQNFAANVMDGALFAMAMSLVSMQTVLPVYVKRIGGSNVHVALIPVLWTFGFNFPQIFIANFVHQYRRRKELFLKTSLIQRLPWFALGAMAYFVIPHVDASLGLLVFFVLFGTAAVAGSMNLPVWFDLVSKLTPTTARGRLFATRNVVGGLLGIVGGWMVERILSHTEYPMNFALLFLLAAMAMMVSYYALTRLKEIEFTPTTKPVRTIEYFRSLTGILRRDANFRNFLVSDALLIAATMAGAFYAVNAIEKFALTDAAVGVFTIIMMASTILGNLIFGVLADRYGHKRNLLLAAGFTTMASVVALSAPSAGLYSFAFVGSALAVSLGGVSRLSIVAELCSDADRPTYVALTNVVTSPFILFGLIGGWIANRFGFDAVFVMTALLAATSAIWMKTRVREPRNAAEVPVMQSVQYEA
jgi:MFS family permease